MSLSRERQAGVEIRVTLAMEAAGSEILSGFDENFDKLGETVAEIYRAMDVARHGVIQQGCR